MSITYKSRVDAKQALKLFIKRREKSGKPVTTEELVAWDASHGRLLWEWDDAKAGHEFRLIQARNFMNHLVYRTNGFRVRVWSNLEDEDSPGSKQYWHAGEVQQRPELHAALVEQVTKRIETQAATLAFLQLSPAKRRNILDRVSAALAMSEG